MKTGNSTGQMKLGWEIPVKDKYRTKVLEVICLANTHNYDLPLLDTGNIPSWLVGWNQAMNTIDLALDGLQEQIDGATGEPITVDSELSLTSENPVQNKIITSRIDELQQKLTELNSYFTITITSQPQDVTTTTSGGAFTVSVTATSGVPLEYQWYYRNVTDTPTEWMIIGNATDSNYSSTMGSGVDGTKFQYRCHIKSAFAEIYSEPATVLALTNYTVNLSTPSENSVIEHNGFYNFTGSIVPAESKTVTFYFVKDGVTYEGGSTSNNISTGFKLQIHFQSLPVPLPAGTYKWYAQINAANNRVIKSVERTVYLT